MLRIESSIRCARFGDTIGGMVGGGTLAKGQNFDTRGRMFSDRRMIGFVRGGQTGRRLIRAGDFPDSDDSMALAPSGLKLPFDAGLTRNRHKNQKCGFILSLGNMAQ